jgi:hypothetical protein
MSENGERHKYHDLRESHDVDLQNRLTYSKMARPYFGLRGQSLIRFIIITVVLPAYCLLRYNNAVFGGLLSLESFVEQFPTIDTVHTTRSTQSENARIQGTYAGQTFMTVKHILILSGRHSGSTLHCGLYVRCVLLLLPRRQTRTSTYHSPRMHPRNH